MTPHFHFSVWPVAGADAIDGAQWYEEERGLSREFLRTLDACFAMIRRWPESQLIHFGEPDAQPPVRRALVRHFPYSVYCVVKPDRVEVLARLHARRDPDVWRRRATPPAG